MAGFFQHFRSLQHPDPSLDEAIEAIARHELSEGTVAEDVLRRARKRAADESEVESIYVQLRTKQLRRKAEKTLHEALDQLDRDVFRRRAALMSTPGKHGSAWDDLTHQVRLQDSYRTNEEKTLIDTIIMGSVAGGFFVVVLIVGLVIASRDPILGVLMIGFFTLFFWIMFGFFQEWWKR